MSAENLLLSNREVFFPKAITAPKFGTKTVLARNAFQFVELWLRRNGEKEALFYWTQSQSFYSASRTLPPTSSPLTSYYCMLNAVKTLLTVNKIQYSQYHGVSGGAIASRKSLENEMSELHNSGVTSELARFLEEKEKENIHSLEHILANLPFIHRAYTLTRGLNSELFISINNVRYVRHPTANKVWCSAEVVGQHADRRALKYMPPGFEIDEGIEDRWVIRRKSRISWFPKRGASDEEKLSAINRLNTYHKKNRIKYSFYFCSERSLVFKKAYIFNSNNRKI